MATIKETFEKRKKYDEANTLFEPPTLPSLYTNYFLDSWNISPFYGKVDTLGIPVIPKTSLVRYCSYGNDKIKVLGLQPVTDFFFSLREQYLEYYAIGAFNKNSSYLKKDIPPVKGFINSSLEFPEIIQSLYSDFVQYMISKNKFNSIKNYEDFILELLSYIKIRDLYFTRAGYVESTDYSLLHTGLALEIYNQTSSNDDERLAFFQDINYDSFLELCIRNNLKIDREIPWRVYLDIRTKPLNEKPSLEQKDFKTGIQNYIPQFSNNLQLFFDTYYDRVVPYDDNSYAFFEEFTQIVISFYFSFVENYPVYTEYLVSPCGKADVRKTNRSTLPKIDYEKYFDLYLSFRNVELRKVVEENTLKINTEISKEIYASEISKGSSTKKAVISAYKYYNDNVGTLAYRNPSLYELDEQSKMP